MFQFPRCPSPALCVRAGSCRHNRHGLPHSGILGSSRASRSPRRFAAWRRPSSGLQGKASLGYEMFRASTIRLLVQVDATLPMFRLSREVFDDVTQTLSRDRVYAPTLTLCLGLGWGSRSN